MLELEEFVVAHRCRLIVTGDTKQYHSVERGDALRILEQKGALTQAVLTKIYRQRIPELRDAIEDLIKGTVRKTTDAQQRDAITYEPGQVIEFHRMAKGCLRAGVKEKKFKSGEQWAVVRRQEGIVIVARSGQEKLLHSSQVRIVAPGKGDQSLISRLKIPSQG